MPDDNKQSLTVAHRVVPCPCCKGDKFLRVWDAETPEQPPWRMFCCHCFGMGIVRAEAS